MNKATDMHPAVPRPAPDIAERLALLRCFAAVARHGSALRAAEFVCLSQPAVTRAILRLERICGTPLFERGARGMACTAFGARLARRAEALFDHLAHGVVEAAALCGSSCKPATPQRFAAAVTACSLKAFIAVAATGTEARAAAWAGVSQPALHRALRMLRHVVKVDILRQSSRGTRLTEAGEALLRRIKLAFAEARAMEGELAAWRGDVRGRVVIGALPLAVSLFLPQAVSAVRRLHPELHITVVDGTYESLMHQLLHADVDVIVGALREGPAEVRQDVFFEERLAVVARANHPCLTRSAIGLHDLLAWEWIVPLAGTPASAALRRAFAACGLEPPSSALQANNALFTRSTVLATDMLALTSAGQAMEDERSGLFRRVPVELPQTSRPIGVAVRDGSVPSPELLEVLGAMRKAAHERFGTQLCGDLSRSVASCEP